jgi:hypothetical protein
MIKKIQLILLLYSSLIEIQAQDTTYISLEKMILQIETNYPSLHQYEQNALSWHAKATGSTAWMPPTISAGVMRFPYSFYMIREKDPANQAGIAFSIEQIIPNQSKLSAKKDYFNSLSEIEKNKRDWTKNQLRREAKILYYKRFANERKQQIISESEAVLSLLLATTQAKFSSNQSQLQTMYKARARLIELKNMQYMLSGLIAESNIGLNILMVRDVNKAFSIDTLIEPRTYQPTDDSGDISNRNDIIALSNYILSMKLEQQVMKIGTKPDFGIRAEHAQMFGMPNQWSLMGMISVPIVPWSAKWYRSESKSIGFQIRSMELEKQTMELMARRMLTEKLTMLNYETGQYENFRKDIIPAFENNLQANLLAYNQNTGDFFVLLDAWEMLLMKKIEMIDKLFNILKLEAEYEYEKEIK